MRSPVSRRAASFWAVRLLTVLAAASSRIRKKGKLPGKTIGQEYTLEYGVDSIEIHDDAIDPGQRILIVDDLIATGGTAEAAIKLVRQTGGEIVGATFVIDLPEIGGKQKIEALDVECHYLVAFEGH